MLLTEKWNTILDYQGRNSNCIECTQPLDLLKWKEFLTNRQTWYILAGNDQRKLQVLLKLLQLQSKHKKLWLILSRQWKFLFHIFFIVDERLGIHHILKFMSNKIRLIGSTLFIIFIQCSKLLEMTVPRVLFFQNRAH